MTFFLLLLWTNVVGRRLTQPAHPVDRASNIPVGLITLRKVVSNEDKADPAVMRTYIYVGHY